MNQVNDDDVNVDQVDSACAARMLLSSLLLLLDRLLRVDLNEVGLKCLSAGPYTSVRPQKVSSISMTFGM